MTDWQQVNIRVKEPTYNDWKQTAEEEYGGITGLVRTSVRREIDGHHGAVSGEEAGSTSGLGTEIAETVDRLENTVNKMDKRLNAVQESVGSTGPEISVEAAIRETLPVLPENHDQVMFPDDTIGMPARVVAARLNAEEYEIREKLQELEKESPAVGVVSDQHEPRYYTRESA